MNMAASMNHQQKNKHFIMVAEKLPIEIQNVTPFIGGGGWVLLNLQQIMTRGGWVSKNAKFGVV